MLRIHHYRVCIIYMPCQDLYTADWLSQNNHEGNRDQEITCMNLNVSAISTSVNMPVSTSIEDIQVTHEDAHMQKLRSYIIQDWPHKEDELENSRQIEANLQ